jgi:cyclopropane fatty-acyl-phospholipid synthase-like methyltransferase
MSTHTYIGSELEIFQHACNWKSYYGDYLRPFLGHEVLEVGAGIGATTSTLCRAEHQRWICLEPDPALSQTIDEKIRNKALPAFCESITSTVSGLADTENFNSILYIDVLEHIEHDREELLTASRHLKNNGYLIVLSPAHDWLYSPFDKTIGHYRRYDKLSLRKISPPSLELTSLKYFDAIGFFASLANKTVLKSSMPTLRQVLFWDKILVPISRVMDPILRHNFGKTIIAIWKKI